MKILAHNTTIKQTTCTPEQWIESMKEVEAAMLEMRNLGAVTIQVRYLNEINEITPCNVDRAQWFFRVVGRDEEAAVSPVGFACRASYIEIPQK